LYLLDFILFIFNVVSDFSSHLIKKKKKNTIQFILFYWWTFTYLTSFCLLGYGIKNMVLSVKSKSNKGFSPCVSDFSYYSSGNMIIVLIETSNCIFFLYSHTLFWQ